MSRTTKLYVGDLKEDVSKEDLEKVFCTYGELRQVWVSHSPPGYAFVDFEDPRDAEDAAKSLDKRTVLGSRIRVEFSRSSRTRNSSGGEERYPPRSRLRRPFNPSDLCYECGQPGHYAYDCEIRIRRMRNARACHSPSPYRRRRGRSNSSRREYSGRRYRSRSTSRRRNRSRSNDDKSDQSSTPRHYGRRSARRQSSGSSASRPGRDRRSNSRGGRSRRLRSYSQSSRGSEQSGFDDSGRNTSVASTPREERRSVSRTRRSLSRDAGARHPSSSRVVGGSRDHTFGDRVSRGHDCSFSPGVDRGIKDRSLSRDLNILDQDRSKHSVSKKDRRGSSKQVGLSRERSKDKRDPRSCEKRSRMNNNYVYSKSPSPRRGSHNDRREISSTRKVSRRRVTTEDLEVGNQLKATNPRVGLGTGQNTDAATILSAARGEVLGNPETVNARNVTSDVVPKSAARQECLEARVPSQAGPSTEDEALPKSCPPEVTTQQHPFDEINPEKSLSFNALSKTKMVGHPFECEEPLNIAGQCDALANVNFKIQNDINSEQNGSCRNESLNSKAIQEQNTCCNCKDKLDECAKSLRRYRNINRKIILTDKLVQYAKKTKIEIDQCRMECAQLKNENEGLRTEVRCLFKRIAPLKEEVESCRRRADEAEAICEHVKSSVVRSLQSQLAELRRQLEAAQTSAVSAKQTENALKSDLEKEREKRMKVERDCIQWQDRLEECHAQQEKDSTEKFTRGGKKRPHSDDECSLNQREACLDEVAKSEKISRDLLGLISSDEDECGEFESVTGDDKADLQTENYTWLSDDEPNSAESDNDEPFVLSTENIQDTRNCSNLPFQRH